MYRMCVVALVLLVIMVAPSQSGGGTPVVTPSTYMDEGDRSRLRSLFLSAPIGDSLPTAYYALTGLQLLNVPVPDQQAQAACSLFKQVDPSNLEQLFYATGIGKLVSQCKFSLTDAQKSSIQSQSVSEGIKVSDLYYAVNTMKNLNMKVDHSGVQARLSAGIKSDDSVMNLAYAFHLAATFTGTPLASKQEQYYRRVEDAVEQADEVDGKYLQFEGGVSVTSFVIDGIYSLCESVKKAPIMSEQQAIKLTSYLLSRRHVHVTKSAANLLSALKTFTTNKFHIPVSLSLASPVTVQQAGQPLVSVRVCDVMGGELPGGGPLAVVADSATRQGDSAVVLSKKQMVPAAQGKDDKSVFSVNLMESKPGPGFYKLTFTISPQKKETRLIGLSGGHVMVKVMMEVGVEDGEVGVVDREQTTLTKPIKCELKSKISEVLEADSHQRVIMQFALVERGGAVPPRVVRAHQVFVRFSSPPLGEHTPDTPHTREIIFVAEAEYGLDMRLYRFDMDVGEHAGEFASTSGHYSMEVIVGDPIISNPFVWHVADIHLQFAAPATAPPAGDAPGGMYRAKPEIQHTFQVAERRPPHWLSTTFTLLVAILPPLVMLILWGKIGVNVSNFHVSLGSLGFYVGLAATFGLYYCFWVNLNMFTTLKYLLAIGIFTFITGKSMLRAIADRRERSSVSK